MIRDSLKPATSLLRSVIGTNGMAAQMATLEAKIDSLTRRIPVPGPTSAPAPASTTEQSASPAAPVDVNLLLHHSRSALMRDMPAGAKRLLSAGCAGTWYFDWIDHTYGRVPQHLGIEYYAPKPDGLPDNVIWIANTAGNMEEVESGSCDLVISGQNIEHLWPDEVAGFLAESARVLRPGGTLCVDSPNRAMTEPLLWSHPEHTIEFTVPEIRHLFELAGFEVTKEAGIWLCQDPGNGRVLPFVPDDAVTGWTITERLISARDKPEQSFLWWLEGRRCDRAPDRSALDAVLADIFSRAWPERTRRTVVVPGRAMEQRVDGAWVRVPPGDGGVVFYGPYLPLRAGKYRITFDLASDADADAAYARCDITTGPNATVLQQCDVEPGTRQVTFEVELPELKFGVQFRCTSLGRAGFSVRRQVTLTEAAA